MKVDVSIIRRPGIKVDVNLVHGTPHRRRVSVPVRVAPYLAEPVEEPVTAVPAGDDSEFTGIPFDGTDVDEICEDCESGDILEDGDVDEAYDDSCELGELSGDEDDFTNWFDGIEPGDLPENADPDEWFEDHESDDWSEDCETGEWNEDQGEFPEIFMPRRADDEPGSSPNEEDLLRLIAEEEADMAASGFGSETGQLPNGHYVRYLDRTSSGDVFVVDNSRASGQEIICVDGESGRLSRICGIIKHNQPAVTTFTEDEEE